MARTSLIPFVGLLSLLLATVGEKITDNYLAIRQRNTVLPFLQGQQSPLATDCRTRSNLGGTWCLVSSEVMITPTNVNF